MFLLDYYFSQTRLLNQTENLKKINSEIQERKDEYPYDDEIDQLEEASSLHDISHMPSRVKCALLSWYTMQQMFDSKGPKVSLISNEDKTEVCHL